MERLMSISEAIFRYNSAIDHAIKVKDWKMVEHLTKCRDSLLPPQKNTKVMD